MPKKNSQDDIKAFWDNQAKVHRSEGAAVSHDPLAKKLEIAALIRHLDPHLATLEMGCGNGANIYGLLDFLKKRIVGLDYSEVMIETCRNVAKNSPAAGRIQLDVASILDDLEPYGHFPQIFTCRCLINLPSLDLQLKAVENLSSILEPGGNLVLIESVQQGQEQINAFRQLLGLPVIPYHWHNLYLDEPAFLDGIPASLELVEIDNFASLYFLISRVFNAKLTLPGEDPDYFSEINKIAVQLPSFGDCAPLKLFQFRKRHA